ncbi:ARID/BRIGHT DNA-binding domain-containing protein [Striga asiatica]|uniref:ARID/BRIGHT DNA-binding domain-containing protein n=1 Tax=Striga asiatica TaxID=4170 RepID=A0A5A7PPC6_STRAF|nr:ARID/BRIGHT DNA-binding domain-containing protein [Striga asiatica]
MTEQNMPDGPKVDPPDQSESDFPALHDASSPLPDTSRSLKRSRLHEVMEKGAGNIGSELSPRAEGPERTSFQDMLNRNRPSHVELLEDESMTEGDDDVIIDRQGPVPNIRLKSTFIQPSFRIHRGEVAPGQKRKGNIPGNGSRFSILGVVNDAEISHEQVSKSSAAIDSEKRQKEFLPGSTGTNTKGN